LLFRLVRIGAAALAVAGGGCGSDDAAESFALRLGLDGSAEGATCVAAEGPALSCSDFALFCDAFVGIRVLEVDSDGTSGEVLSSACVAATNSSTATLCDLADLQVSLSEATELPRRLLRFEVTVWRDDQLTVPGECPFEEVVFDLAGRPRADTSAAVPAFGRRIELDLGGEDADARVELACVDPGALADQACLPTTVVATLFDLEQRALVLGEQLGNVTVALGTPTREGTGFVIEDGETQPLGLIAPEELAPFFRAVLPERLEQGQDVCVLVTESVARTTTAVTCLQAPAGDLNADVFLLRRDVLDSLLAAAELSFPPQGLVVGRTVAADTGLPIEGIEVSPSDPDVEVIYIDADVGGIADDGRTSASGFFLARDVAFGTTWTASGDGLAAAPVRGGVIQNRATVLNIELAPIAEAADR